MSNVLASETATITSFFQERLEGQNDMLAIDAMGYRLCRRYGGGVLAGIRADASAEPAADGGHDYNPHRQKRKATVAIVAVFAGIATALQAGATYLQM
jgi:hypothetical protein